MIKNKIRNTIWQLRNTKLITYFRNIWLFRKELAEYQDWDYGYSLNLFAKAIELQANRNEKGWELYEHRIVKVANMRRAAEIMRNLSRSEEKYLQLAEEKLGYEVEGSFNDWEFKELEPNENGDVHYELIIHTPEHIREKNRKIFDLSDDLQIDELEELTELLKGTSVVAHRIKKVTGTHPQFKHGRQGILSWWD